jgi:hypothetical protein
MVPKPQQQFAPAVRATMINDVESVMARVAREMVQKAGVDVDKLIDMLVRNASAELTTYY